MKVVLVFSSNCLICLPLILALTATNYSLASCLLTSYNSKFMPAVTNIIPLIVTGPAKGDQVGTHRVDCITKL